MVYLDVLSADTQLFVSLTKSDPFWIAGRSNTGSRRVPVLLSLHIHQHRDDPSFTQCLRMLGQCPEGNYRTWSYWDVLCKAKQGWWLNVNTCNPPAQLVPRKISLLFSQGRVARDCVSQERKVLRIKECVAVVMLVIHTQSVALHLTTVAQTSHTHSTIRLLQLHCNRFRASKAHTPTLTFHGNAVGISHVLKWLVD